MKTFITYLLTFAALLLLGSMESIIEILIF